MNVIVKLPVEIPEETIAELAKRAADQLVNDERVVKRYADEPGIGVYVLREEHL